jgi:D-xylose transport system permease protein|tara:strand:- start:2749 stop:3960 length:1212 start_codon:yes stop_codon:yes gene_type:complete
MDKEKNKNFFVRLTNFLDLDTRLFGLIFATALIWICFNFLTGGIFFSPRNLFNLTAQFSVVGIMATGMVLIIVARNIDLSVGSLLGFIGICGGMFQINILEYGNSFNWLYACLLMLVVGTLIGIFQGLLVAYFGIAAFIVTLGGLLIYRNGAWALSRGVTQAPLDENFLIIGGGRGGTIGEFWTWVVGIVACLIVIFYAFYIRRRRISYNFKVRKMWVEIMLLFIWVSIILGFAYMLNSYQRPKTDGGAGIPIPFLILVAVAAMMTLIANFTKFGRYVYAIGGNPESAELSGINVKKIIMMSFILMGFLSAIASIVVTARIGAAATVTGTMTELNVIAAAVIGGTSLAGGVGTVYGAVLGALFMQSLENGMVLIGIPTPIQKIVIGFVLIFAVWLDSMYRRKK